MLMRRQVHAHLLRKVAELRASAARYAGKPADMLAWWDGDDERTNAECAVARAAEADAVQRHADGLAATIARYGDGPAE